MISRGDLVVHLIRWMGAVLAVLLVSGCATERGVFNYGIHPSLEINRPMWPSPKDGEVPRYMYAGQLLGEQNFRDPGEAQPSTGGKAFWNWILGVFGNEPEPVILQRPQSGVVDEAGRIYVTDTSRQAVYVFDQKQGLLEVWEGIGNGVHFISPTGIALGVGGDVYVADAELGFVVRFNQKGESQSIIGQGELRRPVGLAFDPAARKLYVVDTYAHDIKVFGEDGRLIRTLGQRGDKPGEFNFPTHIALAKGELYVTDAMNYRVQVLEAETGKQRLSIGEQGLKVGNLVRPKGVTVDSEGNIYIVESYYDHLLVYNNKGEFLLPIGGTGQRIGEFYLPSGIWVDEHNRIFVADMFNGRVILFQFLGGDAE